VSSPQTRVNASGSSLTKPVSVRLEDDGGAREPRLGGVLEVVAGRLEVAQVAGSGVEHVPIGPLPARPVLEAELGVRTVALDGPPLDPGPVGRRSVAERERSAEHRRPHPHVDQVGGGRA
jgi:hypothetical protein